jgi:peptidoglycan-N-acetylglucosamine deacetylase
MRFFHIPRWSRILYPHAIWDFFWKKEKSIYLTFDDGPTSELTNWILGELDRVGAHATFFCLGEHVLKHPQTFEFIRKKGHTIGNHGMHHLDGYRTGLNEYLQNAEDAAKLIPSDLYRPPYGRITRKQFDALKNKGFRIVFWSLLTYDFDNKFHREKRIKLILKKTKSGSILVFHDSDKAALQLKSELPVLLDYWKKEGFSFRMI